MTEKVITMCCVGREERRGRVEEPSDVREGHNQEVFVVPRAEEHLKVGGGESQECSGRSKRRRGCERRGA
jgi:hypothetical protein